MAKLSRDELFESLKEVIAQQLGTEAEKIKEKSKFREDLDADSLDLVEMIMELEDQFGIKISDEDAAKLLTVGDALDYLLEHPLDEPI